MKPATFTPALAPVAFVIVTTAHGANINTTSSPVPFRLSLTITLAPNATDTLKSHNLWLPDPESFAAVAGGGGEPDTFFSNLDRIDCAAEATRFAASGLDVNDLVRVTIDNTVAAATTEGVVMLAVGSTLGSGSGEGDEGGGDGGRVDTTGDCTRCGTCQKACFGSLWFLPVYAM